MTPLAPATGLPALRTFLGLLLGGALTAMPLLSGCAGGGGSGGAGGQVSSGAGSGSGTGTGTGAGTGTGSGSGAGTGQGSTGQGTSNAASQAQVNAALAALGNGPLPAPVLLQPGLDAWNDMIARPWPELRRTMIDPRLEAEIRSRIGGLAPTGTVTITGLRNLVIDTAAPLGVVTAAPSGTRQTVTIQAPRAPGAWRVAFTVDVAARVTIRVLGIPMTIGTSFDVSADVSDVRVEAAATLDHATPAFPQIVSVPAPSAGLRLTLRSSDPLFQQVAGAVTQVLDPVIRIAVIGGAIYAQQQAMPLIRQYTTNPFRAAAQPAQGVPGARPLEQVANEISEEIQRTHVPFDMCLPAIMSDPVYGRGTPVEYSDYGDSVAWTSYYMMGEAIRHDLTSEPRALAAVERALRGIRKCADVGGVGLGLLGRSIIPVSDPLIRQLNQEPDYYEGDVGGVRYGAIGDMSRDHYLGALMGCIQVWLRIPSLRPQAGSLITELNDYIQRNDLCVYKTPGSNVPSRATPWAQSPGGVWGYVRASSIVDPARYAALEARYEAVTSVIWLTYWGSRLDVNAQYYKHCLGAGELVFLTSPETDPGRYRDYVKAAAIHHEAIKDHDNAWFDSVWGIVVPAQAPLMGPRIKNSLERWTLRPRRCFPTDLRNDPSVPKTTIIDALTGQPVDVASEPIPIEKRIPHDYQWQRAPFELDNWGNPPEFQYCGIDLVHPYWSARAYGMLP